MANVNNNPFFRQRTAAADEIAKKETAKELNNKNTEEENISTFEEVQGFNSSYINSSSIWDNIQCENDYTITEEDNDQEDFGSIFD